MTRDSWRESEEERRVGGNREKDIDREGERVCVCLRGEIERGTNKETQIQI